MPDKPPPDPADHAEDFSHRYAQEMDYLTGDRMTELGIPTNKIGSRVPGQGRATFIPHERSGGGNDPAGGLTLDSGVFNPDLLGTLPGNQEWAKARLRDRVDGPSPTNTRRPFAAAATSRRSSTRRTPNCPIQAGARHILRAMKPSEGHSR